MTGRLRDGSKRVLDGWGSGGRPSFLEVTRDFMFKALAKQAMVVVNTRGLSSFIFDFAEVKEISRKNWEVDRNTTQGFNQRTKDRSHC